MTILLGLIAALALMGPLRHGGIALALSLSSSLQFCLLIFLLKKKIRLPNLKNVLNSCFKSVFASVVMGLGIYYLHSKWLLIDSGAGLFSMVINLAILVAAGIILYIGIARILGCKELSSLKEMFIR